jgi:hypothetical protein
VFPGLPDRRECHVSGGPYVCGLLGIKALSFVELIKAEGWRL